LGYAYLHEYFFDDPSCGVSSRCPRVRFLFILLFSFFFYSDRALRGVDVMSMAVSVAGTSSCFLGDVADARIDFHQVLEAIYTRVGVVTRVPDAAMQEVNVESLNVLNYPKVRVFYLYIYFWLVS
jgi:hypothetical protein